MAKKKPQKNPRDAYVQWDSESTKCCRCRKNVDFGNGVIIDYQKAKFYVRLCTRCNVIHTTGDLTKDPEAFGQGPIIIPKPIAPPPPPPVPAAAPAAKPAPPGKLF